MAKISPVSIKYMIYLNFSAAGAVEKPDVIGALFGQTEGLLGSELEMRELQKEGKIGRIEVDLKSNNGKTTGNIQIPSALDKSETTLIAAAVETIERIGPTESKIEVEKIEDVRESKRDYIIDRAKKLLDSIQGSADSREISKAIRIGSREDKLKEYGAEKLPAGNLDKDEVIIVEGRADVLNLLRNGIDNVIGMNGTKLPDGIKELSYDKEATLFLDDDRGGRLIAKNVLENARIDYVAFAPEGKEVEELSGKEILNALRKKIPAKEFSVNGRERRGSRSDEREERGYRTRQRPREDEPEEFEELQDKGIDRDKLDKYLNKIDEREVYLLGTDLNVIRKVSNRALSSALRSVREPVYAIVVGGALTIPMLKSIEKRGVKYVAARNFSNISETKVNLISF